MNGCVYRTTDDKCEFYSDHGKGIVSYCDFDDCEEKKPSNADRIRAMTDEELAELFSHLCCSYSLGGKVDCNAENNGCKACWLDWLKQEATEERKPHNNFEMLKNMSMEELAAFINGAESEGRAYGPKGKNAWLNWLKQENV